MACAFCRFPLTLGRCFTHLSTKLHSFYDLAYFCFFVYLLGLRVWRTRLGNIKCRLVDSVQIFYGTSIFIMWLPGLSIDAEITSSWKASPKRYSLKFIYKVGPILRKPQYLTSMSKALLVKDSSLMTRRNHMSFAKLSKPTVRSIS